MTRNVMPALLIVGTSQAYRHSVSLPSFQSSRWERAICFLTRSCDHIA